MPKKVPGTFWCSRRIILLVLFFALSQEPASADLCDASKKFCGYWPGSSSASTGAPVRGGKIKINPAAVPVEKSTGIEAIIYDGAEFALVKGFGRVGAGISMSNSEDTFFGAPAIELPEDKLERSKSAGKYESQKYNLATAFEIYNNKNYGMKQFTANFGVLAKYNKATSSIDGGAGMLGKLGPFTYAYSIYRDRTQLDYSRYGLTTKAVTDYYVETVSVGLFLKSLALDYAILRMVTNDVWTTRVLTASLLLKRTILTLATRTEISTRPWYNSRARVLTNKEKKGDLFAGLQANVGRHLLCGLFYNYYTQHELALGVTFFF